MILVDHGQDLVEHLFLTMKREAQVANATCLAFGHEEFEHAVVHIALAELLHAATNGVEQVVVDIVYLQLLERVVVHLHGTFARSVAEVGQLGGYEVFLALVATQGDACAALRESATVDGRCVEIVDAVLQGIVCLTVDHFLVKLFRIR